MSHNNVNRRGQYYYLLIDFHSSAGPIAVTGIPAELSELHELFLSAGQELRYKPIDCSGKDNIGKTSKLN